MKADNLIIGKAYIVKHKNLGTNPGKRVRRIFKGTETRIGMINCLVFSTKVSKETTCTVDIVKDETGKPTGVKFFKWKGLNTLNIPNEVSIPDYCIEEIKEV